MLDSKGRREAAHDQTGAEGEEIQTTRQLG